MTDSRACVKCGRGIDQWASICPFCNWDQHATPPPETEAQPPSPAASYTPPAENRLKRKVLMLGAGAVLLVASFGVGLVINRDGAPTRAPETLEEQAAERNTDISKPRRADTLLVPAGIGGMEQPITSAPAVTALAGGGPNGEPSEYDRTDATAVSTVQYSEMAKRAKAEKARLAVLVDPRSLTGPAYTQAPRRPHPRPVAPGPGTPQTEASADANAASRSERPREGRAAIRTRPIAQYQPIPPLGARGTARLTLLIGADGDVKQVSIEKPLDGGNTAALLSAVQRWRFKPATENGEPISAPYSVEIRFK